MRTYQKSGHKLCLILVRNFLHLLEVRLGNLLCIHALDGSLLRLEVTAAHLDDGYKAFDEF